MSTLQVVECTTVTPDVVEAFARLTPQLSSSNPAPSHEQLDEIVRSSTTTLLVAKESDRIVGSLTLVLFRVPTGMRAWIEDVVVDEDARGRGVGEALSRAAVDHARSVGAVTVDLTSRPTRAAANRLYQRIGFERRDTNVYRYRIG